MIRTLGCDAKPAAVRFWSLDVMVALSSLVESESTPSDAMWLVEHKLRVNSKGSRQHGWGRADRRFETHRGKPGNTDWMIKTHPDGPLLV